MLIIIRRFCFSCRSFLGGVWTGRGPEVAGVGNVVRFLVLVVVAVGFLLLAEGLAVGPLFL